MTRTHGALLTMVLALLVVRPVLATTANDVCPAAANPCTVTANVAVATGSVLDFGPRALVVTQGNSLSAGAGTMTILAGSLVVAPGAGILGKGTNGDFGGTITITTTGDITVQAAGTASGRIDVSGDGGGGLAAISAGGAFVLNGVANAQSTNAANDGGEIDVQAGTTLAVNGTFNVSGGYQGAGGTISFAAAGAVTITNTLDASGGDFDGGEIDIDSQQADVSVGPLTVDGAATGSGGTVMITAQGNITLNGLVSGAGAGSGGNGGDGGEVDAIANGTTKILAPISLPSGDGGLGGTLDLEAGSAGDLLISAALKANGVGTSSCGGGVTYVAGHNLTFGAVDASGGQGCGGSVDATAVNGAATVSGGTIDLQNGAGGFTLQAQQITVSAGADINADGGQGTIQLTGCTITVASGAKLESTGAGGSNLVQASGQLQIAGTIVSGGTNALQYLGAPPTVTGTISPAPATTQNPTLAPCRVAVCGNGVLDPGEQCDDGNTVSCDGCSSTCRLEVCGNGVVDCHEQCDDGPLNGTPGDSCDATCHLITVSGLLFLPGTPAAVEGCYLEYGIRNPNGAVVKGFPGRTQSCIDGDPACDADSANDGKCTFQVETCMHRTDPRLPACLLSGIAAVNLHRPDPLAPPSAVDAANAASLLAALTSHAVEVLSGTTVVHPGGANFEVDACSPLVSLVVPHDQGEKGRKRLTLSAVDVRGREMRNNHVTLECDPNPAVCGNGKVELGEQCDDGNTVSCDGCSSTCRLEICGNGVVDCHEQCDDGPLNGTPGDGCTKQCTFAPPPLRIGGGGKTAAECNLEWSVALGTVANGKDGFPSFKQSCTAGDPACDFSAASNVCRFHAWACLGGADPRYACQADAITAVDLLKPNARARPPLAALRSVLLAAFGAVGVPVGPGETCTPRIDIDVPAGRRPLTIKTSATGARGTVDKDSLILRCNPAAR